MVSALSHGIPEPVGIKLAGLHAIVPAWDLAWMAFIRSAFCGLLGQKCRLRGIVLIIKYKKEGQTIPK